MESRSIKVRIALLAGLAVGSLAAVLRLGPIAQNPAYHQFADQRAILGIPHFFDVVSNLPFLLVGTAGMRVCSSRRLGGTRIEWIVFFAGVTLVAFGSSYYHASPTNNTLAWDRTPMTVAFMALLSALIGESVSARAGRLVLFPAVVLGIGSVVYWHWTGDLRLYGWVQYFPLLLIPLLFILFPGRISQWRHLAAALLLYGLSKVLEQLDQSVFGATGGIVAGHALKHIAAAGGCLVILAMLRQRIRAASGPITQTSCA